MASSRGRHRGDDRSGARPTLGTVLLTVGDLVEDVLVALSGPPRSGSDTTCRIVRSRGGSAANVAAAAIEAGGRARLLARVGDDDLGARLVGCLAATGVDTAFVQRGGSTGSIVVLVDPEAERTMLTDRGASADLVADLASLEGVRAVHVPAYGLDAAGAVLDEARRRGIASSIDASSVGHLSGRGAPWWRRRIAELAPDVLFADAGEAAYLGLLHDPVPVPVTVVKHGPRPAVVLAGGRRVEVPAERVGGVIDTTGAGDAFAAGYLVATLDGAGTAEATRAGHRLAAVAIARVGALP